MNTSRAAARITLVVLGRLPSSAAQAGRSHRLIHARHVTTGTKHSVLLYLERNASFRSRPKDSTRGKELHHGHGDRIHRDPSSSASTCRRQTSTTSTSVSRAPGSRSHRPPTTGSTASRTATSPRPSTTGATTSTGARRRRGSTPSPTTAPRSTARSSTSSTCRRRSTNATPLLLLHTYPGSFVDYLDMIGPLDRPGRARRRRRGCVLGRRALHPRLRLQHAARRPRLDDAARGGDCSTS